MEQNPPLPAGRARLATVLRSAKQIVSVSTAAGALNLGRREAAKLLSRWREQGWLRRVGRGLYVPVPLDLAGTTQVIEDPWVLAPALFGRSYIGGWTAAHHWDLTEQLFNETLVFTTRRVTHKRTTAQGIVFLVHHANDQRLYGLKTIWRGTTRVNISDAARTLIDMLAMPDTGGGIDHVADCLAAYLATREFDRDLLIRYAVQFGNGAVFKRLGFLADVRVQDTTLAAACRKHLTQGYARLDPDLPCKRLVTSWRLWIPERWSAGADDR
jgi:predicted transcriptional regulator of viral defense system